MPIIGHNKIISFFETTIARQALAQSYCFVGADQVGKRTITRHLAAKILHLEENKLDTYPDYYYLSRQIDEKTGKLKKEITVAQSRQIKERLGNKSWFGNYQVIIIDEAELLNEESGNALLKLLEEAGEGRAFFLLTADDSKLLPTIRSRCQMVFLPLVSTSEIEAGLMGLGYDESLVKEVGPIAWGKPGRAIELCEDQELKNNFYQEINRWNTIVSSPFHKKVKSVEDLLAEESKADTVRTSEQLQARLEVWSMIWRDAMLDTMHNKEIGTIAQSHLSVVQIAALINSFRKSQMLLAQNVNPKLIIENILLSLA